MRCYHTHNPSGIICRFIISLSVELVLLLQMSCTPVFLLHCDHCRDWPILSELVSYNNMWWIETIIRNCLITILIFSISEIFESSSQLLKKVSTPFISTFHNIILSIFNNSSFQIVYSARKCIHQVNPDRTVKRLV